MTKYEEEHHIL